MDKILNEKIEELNKYQKELEELEKNPQTPKKEINLTKCLISMIKDEIDEIDEIKNPKQEEEFHNIFYYFKPEYKEGGYFCSKDFEEKCKMFDEFVKKKNMNIPLEYRGEALKIFLKENFNIDWEWDLNKRLADEYKGRFIIT